MGIGKLVLNKPVPYLKDFYEYNPLSNTWFQRADFSGPKRLQPVQFTINKKGYVGTGSYADLLNDFWEYTPDNKDEFEVYPNPVSEFVIFSSQSFLNKRLELTIVSMDGKTVFTKQLQTTNNGLFIKIDVQQFSKGIYFVEAADEEKKVARKFLKK